MPMSQPSNGVIASTTPNKIPTFKAPIKGVDLNEIPRQTATAKASVDIAIANKNIVKKLMTYALVYNYLDKRLFNIGLYFIVQQLIINNSLFFYHLYFDKDQLFLKPFHDVLHHIGKVV